MNKTFLNTGTYETIVFMVEKKTVLPTDISRLQVPKRYILILALLISLQHVAVGQNKPPLNQRLISYVDHNLDVAQKYTLIVDGKPFYMTNIQIRMEKLRYRLGWDAAARDSIIARAAKDGFNTVSIPIHWYEVEKAKDKFDWTVLDEYLSLINKHNLKMELLWFGHNSGGQTQWLTDDHLRVPDYILAPPKTKSGLTTSQYTIRRDLSEYTLDLGDMNLAAREAYVLDKVMNHIYNWDNKNNFRHPVIGVQLGNEVTGYDFNGKSFTSAQVIAYMNKLGSAVKKSPYLVWTRLNCVWGMEEERIDVNEALRSLAGSNIDFVGVDLYKASDSTIRKLLPYKGLNYRMIMEFEAEVPNAARSHLAALSGNNAFDYYDMCGPDGHGLYDPIGEKGFTPHGNYIEDVRLLNKLLNSDIVDIALNANGYGLFVHNWAAKSMMPTAGVDGITFTPNDTLSQAISIRRSNTEFVLMNTKGGVFNFSDSLKINGASIGYFDRDNKWVNQGSIPFTSRSIIPPSGVTVRLTRQDTKEQLGKRMQAEFASYGLGSFVESEHIGFAGNGYVNLNMKGGVIHWTKVDGGNGGEHKINFRYSNGGDGTNAVRLLINGVAQSISFPPTGSWESYKYVSFIITMKSGANNTIRLEAINGRVGCIDELQVF